MLPRGGLGGPWGKPVDSQDGQRRGEWRPRRPQTAKKKRGEAEEEKKGPQEHPKGIPPIDPGPLLGGNVGFL